MMIKLIKKILQFRIINHCKFIKNTKKNDDNLSSCNKKIKVELYKKLILSYPSSVYDFFYCRKIFRNFFMMDKKYNNNNFECKILEMQQQNFYHNEFCKK